MRAYHLPPDLMQNLEGGSVAASRHNERIIKPFSICAKWFSHRSLAMQTSAEVQISHSVTLCRLFHTHPISVGKKADSNFAYHVITVLVVIGQN